MRLRLGDFKRLIRESVSVLIEGKVDDLKKKYPNIDVDGLVKLDPSPTKKFLPWMIKQVVAGAGDDELGELVKVFFAKTQLFSKKDITAYKSWNDLKHEKSELEKNDKLKSSREKKAEFKGQAVKIYEDEQYLLVRPDTKAAVVHYGKGTKWCISAMEGDNEYYENYTADNDIFYVMIDKDAKQREPMGKIAVAVGRGLRNNIVNIEYYDAKDAEAQDYEIKRFFPITFIKLIKADAVKQPMKLLAKVSNTPNRIPIADIVNGWSLLSMTGKLRVLMNVTNNKIKPSSPARIKKLYSELSKIEKEPFFEQVFSGGGIVSYSTIEWRDKEGLLSRDDGPAIMSIFGDKEWYKNGKRHRLDGPAVETEYANYYVDGISYTKQMYPAAVERYKAQHGIKATKKSPSHQRA